MTNQVLVSNAFKRDAKRLVKKYKTLRHSIDTLINDLSKNAFLGIAYGNHIYKVRLSDKSKGVGKSGGFRVMYYHLNITDNGIKILLMSIFDKSEESTVKKADALNRLKEILGEFESEE